MPFLLQHRLPSSAGSNPQRRPNSGRCKSLRPPSPRPGQDGKLQPDQARRAGRRGSRQLSRRHAGHAGAEKMRVCVAEAGLVPHRVRSHPWRPGRQAGPISDRAPHRPTLAPRGGMKVSRESGRRPARERGRVQDPAHGLEPESENSPSHGRSPGGNPVPLRVLRVPGPAVIPRSAPRRRKRVPRRSRPARHGASEGPGIPAGYDLLPVVLPVVRQDLRPLMGPIVRRYPIGRIKHAVAKHAVAKHAVAKSALVLRRVAGPVEVHCALGQPDSTAPDLTAPDSTALGPTGRDSLSREHPGQDQGRLPRGMLTAVLVQNQKPGDRITTGRVLPVIPGRTESLAA